MESTEDQAVPGSSKDPMPSSSGYSCMGEFMVNERASFLNLLPSDIFGESGEWVVRRDSLSLLNDLGCKTP